LKILQGRKILTRNAESSGVCEWLTSFFLERKNPANANVNNINTCLNIAIIIMPPSEQL
jgi:hypothetical protein